MAPEQQTVHPVAGPHLIEMGMKRCYRSPTLTAACRSTTSERTSIRTGCHHLSPTRRRHFGIPSLSWPLSGSASLVDGVACRPAFKEALVTGTPLCVAGHGSVKGRMLLLLTALLFERRWHVRVGVTVPPVLARHRVTALESAMLVASQVCDKHRVFVGPRCSTISPRHISTPLGQEVQMSTKL